MKYCAKCGTPMSDDAVLCPQCHPETNNQQPQISSQEPQKNTSRKTNSFVLTNVVISILTLIATIGMHFVSPSINNSVSTNDNLNSTNSNVFNSICPADEYGNHDWAPAKCTEPAQCYNCNAYKDDKLGEHSFYTDDDGFCDCTYCGILYDVYIDSLD